MEFRILGPVRFWADGKEDALSGTKQRTMFAALLLAGERSLSDERLGRLLWGDRPPSTARAQVHTYASRIRRRLGPQVSLVRIRGGYQMSWGDVPCDYTEFKRLSQEGLRALRSQEFEGALKNLTAALSLWRGECLTDATDHLIMVERPQLEEARIETLEARLEAELILGQHRHVVSELTGLVSHYPMRERFRALLMTALYRSERQAEAMSLYADGRRILAEELGVEPGLLLSRTYEAILAGDARTMLPHQLTS